MSKAWPASLPAPQFKGFNTAADVATIRTDGDGKVAVRNRQSAIYATTNITFKMTTAQLATFEAFFKYDLFNGTAWVTGFTMHDGTKSVRFKGDPAYVTKYLGNRWEVKATVEWEV